jgi:hypothetical protein
MRELEKLHLTSTAPFDHTENSVCPFARRAKFISSLLVLIESSPAKVEFHSLPTLTSQPGASPSSAYSAVPPFFARPSTFTNALYCSLGCASVVVVGNSLCRLKIVHIYDCGVVLLKLRQRDNKLEGAGTKP